MNLAATIIPRSDQMNSDDLIAGPRTITITDVREGNGEQPVMIFYQGDNGKPFKPSKSMRRVLVSIWGTDGNAYVGRRLTLYRDPLVKWAGEPVGGIRISHASDIEKPHQIALTETRGKRKPFVVEPLPPEKPATPPPASEFIKPEGWDSWSNQERGVNRAYLGKVALEYWWKRILTAEEREQLKAHLTEWKSIAAGIE